MQPRIFQGDPAGPLDIPGYWFARLEESLTCGDFPAAADAAAELRRLGVIVAYPRPVFDVAMKAVPRG